MLIFEAKYMNKDTRIHVDILRRGFMEKSPHVGSNSVNMYARFGALAKTQKILYEFPYEDVHLVSWNVRISDYAQKGHGEDALRCFEEMQRRGFCPNTITYICALKACGSIQAVEKGVKIHEEIIAKDLLEGNVMVGAALVDLYAKCGLLLRAQQIHENLSTKNVVSWSALISGYVQHGYCEEALECFTSMQQAGFSPNAFTYSCILKACGSIREVVKGRKFHEDIVSKGILRGDIVLGNALVDMYAKCGDLAKAQEVLDELPARNIVSWSTVISGYAQQGHGQDALYCYVQMQNEGIFANAITCISILKACSSIRSLDKGKLIHTEILSKGILNKQIVLGNALVDMYAKCGAIEKAKRVIDDLLIRDIVSWNSLISGCSQPGDSEEALKCLGSINREGFFPNAITFTCFLKACGSAGAIEKGKQIHTQIMSEELLAKDLVLHTALVDMYAKCGVLTRAQEVFDELHVKTIGTWNALISGYAQQGHGIEAIDCFKRMLGKGLPPDSVTYLCVLNACCHSGLVSEGQMYYAIISQNYNVTPDFEHHACMVDLFGRAGHFDKAMKVIKNMPSSDYLPIWGALLGACQKWVNVRLGKFAFEKAIQLDNTNMTAYICMANIYTASGMHECAKSIEIMRLNNIAPK